MKIGTPSKIRVGVLQEKSTICNNLIQNRWWAYWATDNECTRHATLAASYQLAQSVLKIGFAIAKRCDREEVDRHSHDMVAVLWACQKS